jgi:diaminopimelate epimerase
MDFGSPLRAGARFFKGHGLGNDYLVVEEGDDWAVGPDTIRRVCDPHRGVGGDGMVVIEGDGGPGFTLRMFNPDGSEFERSGNGLRVAAAHLARAGRVGAEPFAVRVGGGEVVMRVHGMDSRDGYDVSVEMGQVSFDPAAVALMAGETAGTGAGGMVELSLGSEGVTATHVSVGNPHCVVLVDDLSEDLLNRLGPSLATHRAFQEGTNVQFARPAGEGRMDILIWERGVGPTAASGTSACAVAAAAVRRGVQDAGVVTVAAPGGEMRVVLNPDWTVTLRAPVQEVMTGELAPGLLALLE